MNIAPHIPDGMDHVYMLADTIGKRPTGFDGERRAADYLCQQLRDWGLEQVGTEPFPARSWDFDLCRLHCEALGDIEALPIEFSGSTPGAGIEAELVVYESPADFDPAAAAGKIALFYGGLPADNLLLQSNVAAVILCDPGRSLAWHQIIGYTRPLAGALPMITLGFADAVDLLRHDVKKLALQVSTTIQDVTGHNVVGTLPAASGNAQYRLNISGHYDSVPAGGAAADNATGAACAMAVTQALSQQALDVDVDVVIFSAEEIGLNGACTYAEKHRADLQRTCLGIYFDGQGDFLGRNNIHVMAQQEVFDQVGHIVGEIGYSADVHHHFTGLDQVYLSAHGVPTLWFQRSPQLTWHTRADVTAAVSPKALRQSVAAAVEIASRAAAAPATFATGIPKDQAQQIGDYISKGPPCW